MKILPAIRVLPRQEASLKGFFASAVCLALIHGPAWAARHKHRLPGYLLEHAEQEVDALFVEHVRSNGETSRAWEYKHPSCELGARQGVNAKPGDRWGCSPLGRVYLNV